VPPSGWCERIQGVVASFVLVPINQGLVPPSSWCWKIWNLVLLMDIFLIYIINHFVVFSHLGFHINSSVLCMWLFSVMILLMVICS
jgi:hypothetical protein